MNDDYLKVTEISKRSKNKRFKTNNRKPEDYYSETHQAGFTFSKTPIEINVLL